jgi:hypothetical protein
MKKQSYSTSIEVAADPAEVFGHIIHDIPKYWPEDFEGASNKLNDEFVFTSGGGMHYSKHKVIEFEPNKKVAWLVTDSMRKPDNFEWTGTKMIFELTAKGDYTLLTFTYDGLVPDDESDRLAMLCDMVIKENLYNVITNGKN